jgi:hypothetical protein
LLVAILLLNPSLNLNPSPLAKNNLNYKLNAS